MGNELFCMIEDIVTEQNISFCDVTDAILNYYDKQNTILENYDSDIYQSQFIQESANNTSGKQSILSRIWQTIKSFFRMISDSIRRFIDKLTRKSSTTNVNTTSCDSIVLKLLSKSKYNVPDNTRKWPIPKVNKKYVTKSDEDDNSADDTNDSNENIVTEAAGDSRYIFVNIPAGKGSVFYPKQIKVPNNDIISIINNDDKTITFHQAGYGKWDNTTASVDDDQGSPNITGTKKPWTRSSKTALYLIKDKKAFDKLCELTDYATYVLFKNDNKKHHIKFNTACKSIINEINHAENKTNLKEVKVSLKELTDFQKKISELLEKIDAFSDISTDVSSLDKTTLNNFNNLYKKLLDVQVSMNIVSSSFNTPLIVNAKYIGCIKSMALLDEFVNTMINEGIPPKYVAYNTWLVANECIRGNGKDYAPCWGQTRFTFFPPDKHLVYKIAMSGAGITSNKAEIRTSEMFQKMDRVDLIAPVVKHFNSDAIVVMERINSSSQPSYAACLSYTKRCNDAIAEYEKTHKVKLNIRIADQHKDNVMYDKKNGCYRSIDYGIATRSYIKSTK